MIAIGKRLKSLGCNVVISLAQPYADLATQAGLTAEPVIGRDRFDQLLSNASVWKPIRGARAIIGEVAAEFLPMHLDVIQRHHVSGETVLVSHPLDLAARVFRDLVPATPLVDVHLAPSMLRTYDQPPRMTPWWWEFSRPEWLVRMAYRCLDAVAVDPVIAGPVNAARCELGLPNVKRIIDQWWLSPDRILAMYPDWFAPATQSFAPRLVHCGFPLFDADESIFAPPSDRPLVFTAGTAHRHSRQFFETAMVACETLQHPGLLVSSHAPSFPERKSPWIRTVGYVPFAKLLPHCSIVVHHGGIGTTSQCLAAGVKQLICPMAFDQFDNATRIEQLGVGNWLKRSSALTVTLRCMLGDELMADRASQIAIELSHHDSVGQATDAIIALSSPPSDSRS